MTNPKSTVNSDESSSRNKRAISIVKINQVPSLALSNNSTKILYRNSFKEKKEKNLFRIK